MITFTKLWYKNILSTGNNPVEIELNVGNLTLIVGKNGSGKSSVPEALCFGLYGKAFRPFNKPQLVNSINQKQLLVVVDFQIGTKKYQVKRGIKPNVFEIYEDGKLINQDPNLRDYQKVLENHILKMNYKTFCQIVIMGSSTYKPFMRLTAQERREFIEDLLDIKIFSTMNSLVKNNVKIVKDEIKELEYEIKSLRDNVKLQDEFIKKRKKEQETFVQDINNEILTLNANNDKIQLQINTLRKEHDKLDSSNEHDLYAEFADLSSSKKICLSKIKETKNKIEFFDENPICDSCGQTIVDEYKSSTLSSLRDALTEYENELHKLTESISAVETKVKQTEQTQKESTKLSNQISELNRRFSSNNSMIEKFNKQISSYNNRSVDIDDEMAKLKKFAKDVVTKTELRADKVEQQEYNDSLLNILQDNGVKAKIVKQYIPVINKYVNEYLDSLNFFCKFTLDENFNEIVKSRHRDTFTYESFSDGQKRRIDAALLLTWRAVAAAKNSINTNILFLDEVDGPLDVDGAELLLDLYKTTNIKNVFIISHKGGLEDMADRTLMFSLKNNFTMMEQL